MNKETVKEIVDLTGKLAGLLKSIEPGTPYEWDTWEKLTAAHKQLRSIDVAELVEQPPRAASTR